VYARALANSRDTSTGRFSEAVRAARQSDVVIVFLGEEAILSGEARSRAFLDLPGAQASLVDAIAATGKPIIEVILAGRPLTFNDPAEKARAILYAWHPGTMGGPAIAKLLFGDAAPSGKLPVTFPRTVGQVPIYYDHLSTGRPAAASELGIPMGNPANPTGYTSKYIDVDFTPEYPFGFGLSYTTFRYSNTHFSNGVASAEVLNTGNREAREIVELYVSGPTGGSVARPVRELKGFRRIDLKPGEKMTVRFSISQKDLAYYNADLKFGAEPGEYRVWIAPDSTRGVPADFVIR
ncbi:MAG: glycoside hydrolase family 3 C-terminal domain-containing protein, partial [Bryobacteraceae bacterium]